MERIRAATKDSSEYDVVTSNYDSLPAKSNVFGNGPLRPKPPSENIIQVSPSPQGFGEAEELPQLGVDNPYWFSDSQQFSPSSTPGYGPDDFVVETVNLDKDFFYQFFTSKPMIIDTDVVTSTSVQVNKDNSVKRGRDSSNAPSLSGLPEHLQGNQLLPEHLLKRTGSVDPTEESLPALVNKSKFRRYHVPPEVRIRSGVLGDGRVGKELPEGNQPDAVEIEE